MPSANTSEQTSVASPRLCSAARSRPKLDHLAALPPRRLPPARRGEPAYLAHRREHVSGRTAEQSLDPIRRAAAASRSSAIIATMRRFRPSPTASALNAHAFRRNELRAGGDRLSLDSKHAARQQRSAGWFEDVSHGHDWAGRPGTYVRRSSDFERITGATITASGPRRSVATRACRYH